MPYPLPPAKSLADIFLRSGFSPYRQSCSEAAIPFSLTQGHKGTGHYHRVGGMVFLSALLLQSA